MAAWVKHERIGGCDLYLGDCLEVIPALGRFDAVVTDPPYGISVDRSMAKNSGKKHGNAAAAKGNYVSSGWDYAPIGSHEIGILRECSTYQIIFGGNYFDLPPARCWLVWDKKTNGDFADCELAWTNLQKPVRRIEWMWNGMLRKGGEPRYGHPTQKPEGVMAWCLDQLPRDSVETVLDPYMGSGSTLVACARRGIRCAGVERDPTYFDIACARPAAVEAAPDMFGSGDQHFAPVQAGFDL